MRRRVSHKAKLHRALAELEDLRIYKVVRGDTRCVICATALVEEIGGKRVHTKENPTLAQRMSDPHGTNGTPMDKQFWLEVRKTGKLIGPCGEACGGRAVYASWAKPKRDEMRQRLLAAGVPKDEIEDRLEQAALKEWRKMLSVYLRAEREAKKRNIDTTTLTFDEIMAALEWEDRWAEYERAHQHAARLGIEVLPATGVKNEKPPKGGSVYPTMTVNGTVCPHPSDIWGAVEKWRKDREEAARKSAQRVRDVNRAKYHNHVEFILWVQDGVANGNPNNVDYRTQRDLETTLYYIDLDSVYNTHLEAAEKLAQQARHWPVPWTGQWPAPTVAQQAVAGIVAATTGTFPKCPKCGAALERKTGRNWKTGRPYDFYGCSTWKQTKCSGSMEVVEYDRQMGLLGGQQPQPVTPPPPPVVAGSKAVAAAKALAQQGAPTSQPVTPPVAPVTAKRAMRARRSKAFWNP